VCVEDLVEKQNKKTLFKVAEPSSVPYRTPPACAKMAAYPDHPPVILLPESIAGIPKSSFSDNWISEKVYDSSHSKTNLILGVFLVPRNLEGVTVRHHSL
jgi:hypothetical protein